jgi:hypothetical protein
MPFEIAQGAPDIAPGTYKGTLEKVELGEGTFNGNTGPIRVWHFLIDVAGELMPISATSSMGTGPKTKAYQWLTAILGTAPQAGTVVEDPIGKVVLVTVSKKENGWPKIEQLSPYLEPVQATPGVPR